MNTESSYIWRVENADGNGPYHRTLCGVWRRTASQDRQPAPWDDKALQKYWRQASTHKHSFGFKTIADYHQWFFRDAFKQALHETGLFLTKYSAPQEKIRHGDKQSVFIRDKQSYPIAFRFCNAAGIMTIEEAQSHNNINSFIRKHIDTKGGYQKNDISWM